MLTIYLKLSNYKKYNDIIIYDLIVKMYNYLEESNALKNNISERQITLLKNIILYNIINIGDKEFRNIEDIDYNELYLKQIVMKQIIDIVFKKPNIKEQQKIILRTRYGIDDGIYKTLEETGNIFGVTKACICDHEQKTMRKVRKRDVVRLVEDYFYTD